VSGADSNGETGAAETLPPDAACKNCEYSELTPVSAETLKSQRICRRFPPSPITVFGQVGGKPSMAVHNIFPVVSDDLFCYEFQVREGSEIIPTGLGGEDSAED
jgi:hypothetical protein